MEKFASLILLFALASVGLAADIPRQNQEDDIREAVFRWQFEHNASFQQQKAKVFYLALGEKDENPSDEFMKRFADHKPPVRKMSDCNKDVKNGVTDKKTGEQGLIFRVASIDWKSNTEVEVTGGYYEGGRSGSGNTYTLKQENGKWKETNDKMGSIS